MLKTPLKSTIGFVRDKSYAFKNAKTRSRDSFGNKKKSNYTELIDEGNNIDVFAVPPEWFNFYDEAKFKFKKITKISFEMF